MKADVSPLLTNPMYLLSMSSLELFHSNFLAFLFKENPLDFLRLFDVDVTGLTEDQLIIERECHLGKDSSNIKNKEYVTDLMVGITLESPIGKGIRGNVFPVLIIENKVKSYPNRNQLIAQSRLCNDWVSDTRNAIASQISSSRLGNNLSCKKVVLSMMPYNECIEDFIPFSYRQLASNIRSSFRMRNAVSQYVSDYCEMIECIHTAIDNVANNDSNPLETCYDLHLTSQKNKSLEQIENISFLDTYRKYRASVIVNCIENYLPGISRQGDQLYYSLGQTKYPLTLDTFFSHKQGIVNIFLEIDNEFHIGIQLEGKQFRLMAYGKKLIVFMITTMNAITSLRNVGKALEFQMVRANALSMIQL